MKLLVSVNPSQAKLVSEAYMYFDFVACCSVAQLNVNRMNQ